jgi:uncharacterized NAD(P)/FAD-binding protein YdhS
MLPRIGIIGGGFAGIMTAINLVKKSNKPMELTIIGEKANFARGIAYQSYLDKHILNVPTGKMSAFPDQPSHFLDWIMARPAFQNLPKDIVSNSFLSRNLYGDYLCELWHDALKQAGEKGISVVKLVDTVIKLENSGKEITLSFLNSPSIKVDKCVMATGNQIPKNPSIPNLHFFESPNYFQNPWTKESVSDINSTLPVLIIGNGLTMVDTIIGLQDNKYKGEIYSISPNGFNILPHRHSGMIYQAHIEEIKEKLSLKDLIGIIHKHVKIVRQFGVSAEPIIDALRPHTQRIWRSLTSAEKHFFMSRLRHLFGVARHRIPLHIYDKIQKLRIDGKLHIQSGKILDIVESERGIEVKYYDKKQRSMQTLNVSRVINCTGPETDFRKLEDNFLSQCIHDGVFSQDELKLGIQTNVENFKVKSKEGKEHSNLFTLGSNLKGELWESTAVNELRQQANALAEIILAEDNICSTSSHI